MIEQHENIDCIVVGAGPAGITTAGVLAARGLVVYLLDHRPEERIGHPWTITVEERLFSEMRVPKPKPPVLRPEPEAREMLSPRGKGSIRLEHVPVVSLNLREFTQRLLQGAQERGVKFFPEVKVTGPLISGLTVEGVVLADEEGEEKGELRAAMTVDASGIAAVVRHGLPEAMGVQVKLEENDVCHACQESREVDHQAVMDLVAAGRLKPNVDVIRTGFIGGYSVLSVYVNLNEDRVELLAGVKHRQGLPDGKAIVDGYVAEHPWIGERIMGGQGLIPIRRCFDNMVAQGFAAVGDAACQVVPQHGSGVASAIRGGALLGEVIAKALLKEKRPSKEALWEYNAKWQRGRGAVLANSDLFRRFSETLSEEEIELLFTRKIITPSMIHGALQVVPLSIPPAVAVLQALRLTAMPGLLKKFTTLARRSQKTLQLYQQYPEQYDPESFARWKAQAAKLFEAV